MQLFSLPLDLFRVSLFRRFTASRSYQAPSGTSGPLTSRFNRRGSSALQMYWGTRFQPLRPTMKRCGISRTRARMMLCELWLPYAAQPLGSRQQKLLACCEKWCGDPRAKLKSPAGKSASGALPICLRTVCQSQRLAQKDPPTNRGCPRCGSCRSKSPIYTPNSMTIDCNNAQLSGEDCATAYVVKAAHAGRRGGSDPSRSRPGVEVCAKNSWTACPPCDCSRGAAVMGLRRMTVIV